MKDVYSVAEDIMSVYLRQKRVMFRSGRHIQAKFKCQAYHEVTFNNCGNWFITCAKVVNTSSYS